MRTCAKCNRPLGKAARCLYCGTVATDAVGAAATTAAAAAAARKPVVVACPGCLRNARIPPGAVGTCPYCALAFQIDDDGTARVGRSSSTPAATHAQVSRLVAALPPARLWDLVRDVLARRAAFGELGAGEAERAIDALTLVATWPGGSPQWVPIVVDEVARAIPRLLFGVADGGVLREGGHTVLLSTIATGARAGDLADRAAKHLIAAGASAGVSAVTSGLGFGVSFKPPDELRTESRHQLRAYVVEAQGGVELSPVFNQIDQRAPTPLAPAQERELHTRIAGSRATFASYYILGALFGPSCVGGTAFSITRDAIAQRLDGLGCDSSPELVDQLCIRMPPAFGQ